MHQPPLVLIVDDEPDLLEIGRARLEAEGFKVETASDAPAGFEAAKNLQPDLVLLDMRMPGINGTEALLDFKKDPLLKHIKVAFLTNMVIPWPGVAAANESFAKELGAVKFLDKSKDMEKLGSIVKGILAEPAV